MKTFKKKNIFSQRLRAARKLRELDQAELAMKAGLQASAISHFETGTRKPSFDNLHRLSKALRVTTDYLIGHVEDIDVLAKADELQRDFNKLSSKDQEIAHSIITMLLEQKYKDRPSWCALEDDSGK